MLQRKIMLKCLFRQIYLKQTLRQYFCIAFIKNLQKLFTYVVRPDINFWPIIIFWKIYNQITYIKKQYSINNSFSFNPFHQLIFHRNKTCVLEFYCYTKQSVENNNFSLTVVMLEVKLRVFNEF